jgi:hypothetical protein
MPPLQDANGFNLGSFVSLIRSQDTIWRTENRFKKIIMDLLLDLRKKNVDLKNTQLEFKNFIELSKI